MSRDEARVAYVLVPGRVIGHSGVVSKDRSVDAIEGVFGNSDVKLIAESVPWGQAARFNAPRPERV